MDCDDIILFFGCYFYECMVVYDFCIVNDGVNVFEMFYVCVDKRFDNFFFCNWINYFCCFVVCFGNCIFDFSDGGCIGFVENNFSVVLCVRDGKGLF